MWMPGTKSKSQKRWVIEREVGSPGGDGDLSEHGVYIDQQDQKIKLRLTFGRLPMYPARGIR